MMTHKHTHSLNDISVQVLLSYSPTEEMSAIWIMSSRQKVNAVPYMCWVLRTWGGWWWGWKKSAGLWHFKCQPQKVTDFVSWLSTPDVAYFLVHTGGIYSTENRLDETEKGPWMFVHGPLTWQQTIHLFRKMYNVVASFWQQKCPKCIIHVLLCQLL